MSVSTAAALSTLCTPGFCLTLPSTRVHSVGALARVLEACKAMGEKWYIVGRGSNLLVADEGVDAAVIVLGRDFRSMRYDEE